MNYEFYTKEKISVAQTDCTLANPIITGFRRYRNFTLFEEGGTCRVYECFDTNLNRKVAYKTLHSHLQDHELEQQRFLREARVTSQIQHPNTVPVYEIGRDDQGNPYFTMKLVHGDTLRQILEGLAAGVPRYVEAFDLERRLEILHQVAQAIAFAHARAVIHRDLKPANVLVGDFGEVIVLDWGLAKVGAGPEPENPAITASGEQRISMELTRPGARYGTPLYMSPEQAEGEKPVDERSDVYLLGNLLYEILTLQNLVWGQEPDEIIDRILHDPVIPPRKRAPERHIPMTLEAVCMKALEKRPEERYPSVLAFIEDLRACQRGENPSVQPASFWIRLRRWSGVPRPRIWILAGVAAGLGIGALITWLMS